MDATRSIDVAKVVDETVRIVRNNPAKQTFTLPAFREAGAGTLETEEELQAAREGVRQHNIRDPLAGLDVLWFGTEQPPKWLAVIQLANQKQVLLTHQAEVLDFVNEHFVKPPS